MKRCRYTQWREQNTCQVQIFWNLLSNIRANPLLSTQVADYNQPCHTQLSSILPNCFQLQINFACIRKWKPQIGVGVSLLDTTTSHYMVLTSIKWGNWMGIVSCGPVIILTLNYHAINWLRVWCYHFKCFSTLIYWVHPSWICHLQLNGWGTHGLFGGRCKLSTCGVVCSCTATFKCLR